MFRRVLQRHPIVLQFLLFCKLNYKNITDRVQIYQMQLSPNNLFTDHQSRGTNCQFGKLYCLVMKMSRYGHMEGCRCLVIYSLPSSCIDRLESSTASAISTQKVDLASGPPMKAFSYKEDVGSQNQQIPRTNRSDRSGPVQFESSQIYNLESVCNPIWKG